MFGGRQPRRGDRLGLSAALVGVFLLLAVAVPLVVSPGACSSSPPRDQNFGSDIGRPGPDADNETGSTGGATVASGGANGSSGGASGSTGAAVVTGGAGGSAGGAVGSTGGAGGSPDDGGTTDDGAPDSAPTTDADPDAAD